MPLLLYSLWWEPNATRAHYGEQFDFVLSDPRSRWDGFRRQTRQLAQPSPLSSLEFYKRVIADHSAVVGGERYMLTGARGSQWQWWWWQWWQWWWWCFAACELRASLSRPVRSTARRRHTATGFEIDFLYWTALLWPAFYQTVDGLQGWLAGMAGAATHHNISVQYCMDLPSYALASVEFSSVTNARASNDNFPAWADGPVQEWRWPVQGLRTTRCFTMRLDHRRTARQHRSASLPPCLLSPPGST